MGGADHEPLRCFKAYDIRGTVPDDLDERLALRIGWAFARHFSPKQVVVGHDIRLSSPALARAVSSGLRAGGCDVLDLGLCGTEEVYFATFHHQAHGGIMVTASHNPAPDNGMKFVGPGARPISGESGLAEIARLVAGSDEVASPGPEGKHIPLDSKSAYVEHLLGYIDITALRPLKLVVNSGNGCAGPMLDLLEPLLPFTMVKIHHDPDGSFPNGVPNPLLPEKRAATAAAVRESGADLGIAWDGDFDRCFLFDEQGDFIEGYYLVGLLAQVLLAKAPGCRIIHDPRLVWNTREVVRAAGGVPVMARTGHAYIKERMRAEDALYGGEMSGHHYFRDFGYCDSGMIPWLLACELLCRSGEPLSALVSARQAAYPVSGEINSRVADPDRAIARIEEHFARADGERDHTDGLSISFADYRFNVRKSNTEPVLRLNIETRGDQRLLEEKTALLLALINQGNSNE